MSKMSLAVLILFALAAPAQATTINFEGVPDLTPVAGLYSGLGVTFLSGTILVSGAFGGSLNDVDFPPMAPGQAVFANDLNVTTVLFAQSISSFSGRFTYGGPITLRFFNGGNAQISTLTSAFLSNIGTGGDPGSFTNELIATANLADAVRLEISAPSTDFTMDDMTFVSTPSTPVPEPSSVMVLSLGIFLFACCFKLGSRTASAG